MSGSALEKASYEDLKNAALQQYKEGKHEQAFYITCVALKRPQAEWSMRSLFAHTSPQAYINAFNPDIKDAIFQAMREEGIHFYQLFPAWVRILFHDKTYDPLWRLIGKDVDPQVALSDAEWARLLPVLMDPFFTQGLSCFIASNLAVERLFTVLRRKILLEFLPAGRLELKHLAFIAPLAEMAYAQEYIWHETPEEREALDALRMDDALHVCLRALYQDISGIEGISPKLCAMAPYRRVMDKVVRQTARRKELAADIPALGAFREEQEGRGESVSQTSRDVQAMYEENPYPRWFSFDYPYNLFPDTEADILVAGCGTGWATCSLAKAFPSATIKAIDISRASLGYAAMKAQDVGFSNVSYFQCDIMDVQALEQSFDLIHCTGVLHHMADPLAGWAALTRVLKTGGAMVISLYSTAARRVQQKARDKALAGGYPATPDGIKRFRADVIDTFSDEDLKYITNWKDFFTVSGLRDLVFHVCEKTYTIPEIKGMLDTLGLEFLGMRGLPPSVKVAYRAMFPEDPEMKHIQNWDIFEAHYPETFAQMYSFACARKGEAISSVAQKFFTF